MLFGSASLSRLTSSNIFFWAGYFEFLTIFFRSFLTNFFRSSLNGEMDLFSFCPNFSSIYSYSRWICFIFRKIPDSWNYFTWSPFRFSSASIAAVWLIKSAEFFMHFASMPDCSSRVAEDRLAWSFPDSFSPSLLDSKLTERDGVVKNRGDFFSGLGVLHAFLSNFCFISSTGFFFFYWSFLLIWKREQGECGALWDCVGDLRKRCFTHSAL